MDNSHDTVSTGSVHSPLWSGEVRAWRVVSRAHGRPQCLYRPICPPRRGLLVAARARPLTLGLGHWEPFSLGMTLGAVTLLPLWPAVKAPVSVQL